MVPSASINDDKRYAKTLYQRIPLICQTTGGEHNWQLLASYADCDVPHSPYVMSCSNCGKSRLAIHFDEDDPEYGIFIKKEMWDVV